MKVNFTTVDYSIFGKSLRMDNGEIQLTVTLDIGPRIISAGFINSQNFCFNDLINCNHREGEVYESVFGKGSEWHTFGGHRVWASPESYPHSYYPDCEPVEYETFENGAVFTSPAQRVNLVQNILRVEFNDDGSVKVSTMVKNKADFPQRFAAWGLTVLDGGGVEIIPQADEDTGLLANRVMGIWPEYDMSDDRVFFGERYITLHQDAVDMPFKIGTNNQKKWCAYLLNDEIFKKTLEFFPDCEYPDYGCSFETFTNRWFIEMESLSPIKDMLPNEIAVTNEIWSFKKAVGTLDRKSNASIEAFVKANGLG